MFDNDFFDFLCAYLILSEEPKNAPAKNHLFDTKVVVVPDENEQDISDDSEADVYDEKDEELDDYFEKLELRDYIKLIKEKDEAGKLNDKMLIDCPFDADYLIYYFDKDFDKLLK